MNILFNKSLIWVSSFLPDNRKTYHLESRNNTLGRYLIVSFAFRFGTFGNRRVG